MAYARHKWALGICDRCGRSVKLKSMVKQPVDGRLTELKVCTDCYDVDNPQWRVRLRNPVDPLTLPDPRPDEIMCEPNPSLRWGGHPLWWDDFNDLVWGETCG
jgi:hypothetical protein